MEVSCIFTRQVEPGTYKKVSESEILDRFREIVENYIDACPKASLVSVEGVYMDNTGSEVTPQPFLEAVVNCEEGPEANLVENDVSMIGDASYFDDDLFPIRLLGASYWVDESLSPSEEVEPPAEENTEDKSLVDRIVNWLFSAI